ncbi:sigma non-opioid intracellular receptor 1-like [Sycon ciliatum]|uniref:sigma non-opioid intracellular receptor 1-like n=1 Tax=Sycon ciliatum TaxID=27933 RepID=UPI0020AD3F64|eukprot:scpid68210/ scgid10575/ Sigma non-opioid intracellular receptor 1; Sigma 1-type opioid receptor
MKRWRAVVTVLFVLPVVVVSIHRWLLDKSYVFTADEVASVARNALENGHNGPESFDFIIDEMRRRHPGHILPKEQMRWVFVNCGGWMGAMKLLHASLTEYVILFGTAVNTSGNSGRYYANITDTIVSGKFWQWKEGEEKAVLYGPGDTVYHHMFEVAAVEWSADTWMLEYGRGLIPSTLGFALADTVFSTTDFWNMGVLLHQYGLGLWLKLNTSLLNLFGYPAM